MGHLATLTSFSEELFQLAFLKRLGLGTLDVSRFYLADVFPSGMDGGISNLVLFDGLGQILAICFVQDHDDSVGSRQTLFDVV